MVVFIEEHRAEEKIMTSRPTDEEAAVLRNIALGLVGEVRTHEEVMNALDLAWERGYWAGRI